MQKKDTAEIGGKDVVIKELKLRHIKELIDCDADVSTRLELFLNHGSNLTMDEVLDFAPSDLEEAWAKFQEVNKVFFVIARRVGMGKVIDTVADQIPGFLTDVLANLFGQDTDKASGTTDTASS